MRTSDTREKEASSADRTLELSWVPMRPPCSRLWREKRGEAEPEDLSGNLSVQLGARDRTSQPAMVRAHHRTAIRDVQLKVRHPVVRWMAATLDGDCRGHGRRIRGQVHAALVVLGRGGGGETHGPAPAQHVGHQRHHRGPVYHYRWRQVGRDQDTSRFALSTPASNGGKEVLALRGKRRARMAPHLRISRSTDIVKPGPFAASDFVPGCGVNITKPQVPPRPLERSARRLICWRHAHSSTLPSALFTSGSQSTMVASIFGSIAGRCPAFARGRILDRPRLAKIPQSAGRSAPTCADAPPSSGNRNYFWSRGASGHAHHQDGSVASNSTRCDRQHRQRV